MRAGGAIAGRAGRRREIRFLSLVIVSGLLAGCAATAKTDGEASSGLSVFAAMYAAMPDERFPIPALTQGELEPRYHRQRVNYRTDEQPGTIVVDVEKRYLYLVEENGKAMRYGIGVGRQGFSWNGRARIGRKKAWPTWTPPKEMIERQPELAQYANGMEPGLENPLGARALYLFQGNKDTLYRLHGTNEVYSIGKAVSSGCIRLLNQDIIDLYQRVPVDSEVVVILPAALAGKENLHDHGSQDDG
ncbi:MAG: L,D-transpeptidase [Fimbriimonadaceae bacterium]|nr:L,D-transpeptidase [Alphaproteobacteria bacterium]